MLLDPWMTPENLNCVKDAYFFARRFQDVVAIIARIPRGARGRGSQVLLTLSYALLGRVDEAAAARAELLAAYRSEEHTSELQSLMRISYAVFCLKKKQKKTRTIL